MPVDLFEKHGIDLNEDIGFFKNLGQGLRDFSKGAAKGIGQSIGDLGASALNLPISGLEYALNRELPHVPHPHLMNENPSSLSESVGQVLGQLGGSVALPGGAAMKAAQLANRGYRALRAAKELPLAGRLGAAGLGGAVEGYVGNEENRPLGAAIGSLLGTSAYAVPKAIQFANTIRSKNIANDIKSRINNLTKKFDEEFSSALNQAEEGGASRFLKPQKGKIQIIKKGGENNPEKGEKSLTFSLEQYNKNPSLENAHFAQRDLGKIERIHEGSTKGTAQNAAYKEALRLKNRLLQQMKEAFEKSGSQEAAEKYFEARNNYRKEMAPYLDSESVRGLIGRNREQKQTIRDKKFADIVLGDETFLKAKGKEHPGLLRREIYNKLKENPFVTGAVIGTAGGTAGVAASALLSPTIRKMLGL